MIKNGMYAIFEYDKCDKNVIDDLDNYLSNNYERIVSFFDKDLVVPKINIKIYSTKKEFDEEVGKKIFGDNVPLWVIGSFNDNKINYVSYNDYKNTSHKDESYEYFLKTIIHEYVHYIEYEYSKYIGSKMPVKYINEGLACYLSGQYDNEKFKIINYEELINSRTCYKWWYFIIKYIIEVREKEYLFELFKDWGLANNELKILVEEINNYYELLRDNKEFTMK